VIAWTFLSVRKSLGGSTVMRLLRKLQKLLGGYFILPHLVYTINGTELICADVPQATTHSLTFL